MQISGALRGPALRHRPLKSLFPLPEEARLQRAHTSVRKFTSYRRLNEFFFQIHKKSNYLVVFAHGKLKSPTKTALINWGFPRAARSTVLHQW